MQGLVLAPGNSEDLTDMRPAPRLRVRKRCVRLKLFYCIYFNETMIQIILERPRILLEVMREK